MTGTIKTLKEQGFGFITAEGLAKDLLSTRMASSAYSLTSYAKVTLSLSKLKKVQKV